MEISNVDNGNPIVREPVLDGSKTWEDLEAYREPETNTYAIPPRGDYAKIQIEASKDIIARIQAGTKGAVEMVCSEPGYYNPCALLEAGLFLVQEKDFERAAVLIFGAMARAEIDIRWSQDKTTGGAIGIMGMRIADACQMLTDEERVALQKHLQNALIGFETWDQKTPRKYDTNWILLHGMGAFKDDPIRELDPKEKQFELERFYRELKGEFIPEDAKHASREDEYFFDPANRKFYHGESRLSFTVPEEIHPVLDRFGKYCADFNLSGGKIIVNQGWSLEPNSFEEEYQWACETADKSETIERCIINGMDAYKTRSYDEGGQVKNSYYLCKGQYDFDLILITTQENEVESLKLFEALINSIKW